VKNTGLKQYKEKIKKNTYRTEREMDFELEPRSGPGPRTCTDLSLNIFRTQCQKMRKMRI